MEALSPRVLSELEAAERHHELVTAALQSHARLAAIEDEYQAKISAYWAEVDRNVQHAVTLRTKRHAEEVIELTATIRELRNEIIRLSVRLLRTKKKPALKAKKKRKASK